MTIQKLAVSLAGWAGGRWMERNCGYPYPGAASAAIPRGPPEGERRFGTPHSSEWQLQECMMQGYYAGLMLWIVLALQGLYVSTDSGSPKACLVVCLPTWLAKGLPLHRLL